MNEVQENAASLASRFINNTNRNVFLTGRAGTGKTTFLKAIVENTHKNAIVAAPTGIAAINAGGVTLHSLFQLPFGTFIPSDRIPSGQQVNIQLNTPGTLLRELQMHTVKRRLLREMELLIIDEVSMLRADLLDAIDVVLRVVRRNRRQPFGGVQVLFIGDLYQLPPVVRNEERAFLDAFYEDAFFFRAHALKGQQPVYIELDKIYRQSDPGFIDLLNRFRDDRATREDIERLNRHYKPGFEAREHDGYIHLTTHNRKAEMINREALEKLPGQSFSFDAQVEGDFREYLYPVEPVLELKEGAQVMFIKNDYSGERRYFNGKIGTVTCLDERTIRVTIDGGEKEIEVEPYIWENKKYTLDDDSNEILGEVTGTFTHYPLKLAWAITVHKSQGLTFERAVIDVSSAFAPGQIYVALSRLTALDGLVLSARIPQAGPAQDLGLARFVEERESDPDPEAVLPDEIRRFIRHSALDAFEFSKLARSLKRFTESHDKDERRSVKQTQKPWAEKLEQEFIPLRETADRFLVQVRRILHSGEGNDYLESLGKRLEAARGYFDPLLDGFCERIRFQGRCFESERKIKTYLSELKDLDQAFFHQRQLILKAEGLIQAALSDEELVKARLERPVRHEDGVPVVAVYGEKKEKRKRKPGKKEGEEKPPRVKSHRISYELFHSGKSIDEIAAERSLTVNTVESHLAHYVTAGMIDLTGMIDTALIEEVISLSNEMSTMSLSPLRERLGKDVTFGQLRLIMAEKLRRANQIGE
jgi:hypothetical protein